MNPEKTRPKGKRWRWGSSHIVHREFIKIFSAQRTASMLLHVEVHEVFGRRAIFDIHNASESAIIVVGRHTAAGHAYIHHRRTLKISGNLQSKGQPRLAHMLVRQCSHRPLIGNALECGEDGGAASKGR